MGEIIGLVAVVMIFGIPLSAILTEHRRKVIEMQLRLRNEGSSNLRAEVEALRKELHDLRDTSMQYDLSFDGAMQQMEHRVSHLERKSVGGVSSASVSQDEAVVTRVGR